ncbi:MAG: MFS transporter, partial [Gammaproteobacteria bacterium]|nr:MFS transporter [Gammaproteobacteria bacterium]
AVFLLLRAGGVGARPVRQAVASARRDRDWGIRDRTGFWLLAGIVFLDITVQGGFLTFIAFLMIEKEVPANLAAVAVVLTLAGGIFGKFGCGLLADRIGVVRALWIVQLLTAAGILAIAFAPTLLAYCLLPMLGVVLQGSSSITYATVGDLVHKDRQSRGFAAIYSLSSAAGIVGPIIFGLLGDGYGLVPAMITMAVVVLLTLPLGSRLGSAITAVSRTPD